MRSPAEGRLGGHVAPVDAGKGGAAAFLSVATPSMGRGCSPPQSSIPSYGKSVPDENVPGIEATSFGVTEVSVSVTFV